MRADPTAPGGRSGPACPACDGPLSPWRPELARCSRCGTAVTVAPAPETAAGEEAAGGAAAGTVPGPGGAAAGTVPGPGGGGAGTVPGPGGGGLRGGVASPAPSPRGSRLAAPVLAAFDRRRLRILRAGVAPPARLVDAGAGRGRFVAAARRAGYDAEGFEPDPGRAAAAASYGVALRTAGIEDAEIAPGSVDAVTAWHVLEHVVDPDAAVARIAGWLRPGGALLVGVPNLDSLQARIGGGRWYHLDLPRHRTHLTPAGLDALLRRHGLEPVRTHHVLAEHNPFGMWQTLANRLTRRPSYLFHLLKREAPVDPRDLAASLLALPLLPLAALLELAAGLARRGGTVAVLAVRR